MIGREAVFKTNKQKELGRSSHKQAVTSFLSRRCNEAVLPGHWSHSRQHSLVIIIFLA